MKRQKSTQGIQRTALAPDGTAIKRDGKTFRLTLGAAKSGTIKIDPDEHVTMGLCVGEGFESTLTGRQIGLAPVWALGSVGAIERFPVLGGIESLTILAEADEASGRAVQACFEKWRAAGREVLVLKSTIGSDVNDAIRRVA
jgi:putative DNA primase/helicase